VDDVSSALPRFDLASPDGIIRTTRRTPKKIYLYEATRDATTHHRHAHDDGVRTSTRIR